MSDQPDITGVPARQAGFAASASALEPGHVFFEVCVPRDAVLENANKPDALLPFLFEMDAAAATSIATQLLSAVIEAGKARQARFALPISPAIRQSIEGSSTLEDSVTEYRRERGSQWQSLSDWQRAHPYADPATAG